MSINASDYTDCGSHSYQLSSSHYARINFVIVSCSTAVCAFLAIIVNLWFIFAEIGWNKRERRTHHANNLYILLSFSDLLSGLVLLPIYIMLSVGFITGSPYCNLLHVRSLSTYTIATMSITVIACITLEVYFSIDKPFVNSVKAKRKFLIRCTIAVWTVCVVLPLLTYYIFPGLFKVYKTIATVYGLLILCFLAYSQHKVRSYLRRNTTSRLPRYKYAANIALLTFLVYCCCYLPAGLNNIGIMITGSTTLTQTFIDPWCYCIALSNSFFDTFVYGLRSRSRRVSSL
ncbi:uncharacterized protein LOC130636957 [Hydractinia symbiolongicarpus]|uniref:uncharacterized protein LOC130636957 n=1 Tax=Hydractinia symbiolongicarpus TaxID=13093 RepID=UPI00254A6F90|nr:uncharacterized protein LOC130636957 [Hydractinia symbiolongicarpus]